jgi:hypothetical protein
VGRASSSSTGRGEPASQGNKGWGLAQTSSHHHETGCHTLRDVRSLGGWARFAGNVTEAAAPDFVPFEVWAFLPPASGDFPNPQLSFLGLVHHYRTRLSVSIMAETAPPPLLRLQNQSALDRITMHVAQLLHPFVF